MSRTCIPTGPAPSRSRTWLRRLRSVLGTALTALALFSVLPAQLGGLMTFTVVSGHSMDPTYHTYDLALTYRSGAAKPGDVIVYRVPEGEPGAGGQVIHRVIGGDGHDGYVTKGDNREGPDIWRPRQQDVVGKVVGIVPQGGKALVMALNVRNLGLVALGFFAWALWPRREPEDSLSDKAARRLEILLSVEGVAA